MNQGNEKITVTSKINESLNFALIKLILRKQQLFHANKFNTLDELDNTLNNLLKYWYSLALDTTS